MDHSWEAPELSPRATSGSAVRLRLAGLFCGDTHRHAFPGHPGLADCPPTVAGRDWDPVPGPFQNLKFDED